MPKEADETAKEFARRVREMLGERVLEIVLFGSRAREDARGDSDYDVMIVMKGDKLMRKDRIRIVSDSIKIFADLDADADVLVITEFEKEEQVDKPYTITYHAFNEGARL